MDIEELELVNLAKNGNKRALEKLIKLEQKNIYSTLLYLKKDEAEIIDIVQNVLIKVSKNISNLKKTEFFKTWLNKIILNTYYDYTRKNKRNSLNSSLSSLNYEICDNNNNPSSNILYNELDFKIKQTIEVMPLHYKIPIVLREIRGLSYETISKMTNTTLGTVKSRIARAREIIKHEIEKYAFW